MKWDLYSIVRKESGRIMNKKFLWLYIIINSISWFSSEIGITIGGIKINLSDMFLVLFCVMYLLKHNGRLQVRYRNASEISKWIILFVAMILQAPLGIFNGSPLGESIRILRNTLYIPVSFVLFNELADSEEIDNYVIVMGILTSAEVIIGALYLYRLNDWFVFYRANGVFSIVLFCYLFNSVGRYYKSKKIIGLITIVLLIGAMFLSQERTELIASVGAVAITSVVFWGKSTLSIKNTTKKIGSIIAVIIVGILTFFLLKEKQVIKDYVDYYFTYRLASGNFSLTNDKSYMGRLWQYQKILSVSNPLYMIFGRGTGALYEAAQGVTSVVDGMPLWIFKDLGLLGCIVYFWGIADLIRIRKRQMSIRMRGSFASAIGISIFMFFNPGFIGSSRFAFVLALCSYLKKAAIENLNNRISCE